VEIHLSKQSNFLSVWMRLVHKVDHLLVKLVLCIDTETWTIPKLGLKNQVFVSPVKKNLHQRDLVIKNMLEINRTKAPRNNYEN